jgi:murein DD-endopeptidase MepM/ murein hydrolase activator NlpD
MTGSLPPGQAAPISRVETRGLSQPTALPPPQASYNPPPPTYTPPPPSYTPPVQSGWTPGPQPAASAVPTQPAAPAPVAAMRAPAPAPVSTASSAVGSPTRGNWTADGGTPITLGAGDTLNSVSRRYGVPVDALARTNGIADPSQVQAGQRLTIPVFRYGAPPPPVAATPAAPAPVASVPAAPAPATTASVYKPQFRPAPAAAPVAGVVHTVESGDTLFGIARRYGVSHTDIARANRVDADHKVVVGEKLTIPGAKPRTAEVPAVQPAPATQRTAALSTPAPVAAAPAARPAAPVVAARPAAPASAPAPTPAPVAARPATTAPAAAAPARTAEKPAEKAPEKAAAPIKVASAEPVAQARLATPASDPAPGDAEAGSASGNLRWPVRGRIISAFGDKASGQSNDGIKIAAPEGTPFKAAEDGVVAYAGNELKGYGNLVLIKHSNGVVTAYAHAAELNVKRGETVRRGQVIGKTGQTGSVNAPQLHFEVRNGAKPVDPMGFLGGQ